MQAQEKILIKVDPTNLMLVSIAVGAVMGLLMVGLDPWLRFPDVPLRINIAEALLTASIMASYGAVLSWTITTFWRTWLLWLVVLLMTPLITGAIAVWNNANAAFGVESNLLIFLPFVLVLHAGGTMLTILYLNMALQFSWRRALAFTALPVVLVLMSFLVIGRIRWANQDAQDVVAAVDFFAESALGDEDYSIEYLGIRFNGQQVASGDARIHTDDETIYCRVRLFPTEPEISCREE